MDLLLPFESAATPLHRGTTLIEASAGTGKTFTIAGLILRLVLEEGMGIGEILAVTYTVAATEELRDRVRKRLRRALEDLRRGTSEDETVSKCLREGKGESGIRALNVAVQNFDEAQIFTIHGFCQRVLRENAFESGALFDMELMADSSPILDEVARDFWRRRFYDAPPLLSRLALARGISHERWSELLNRVRNHPRIRIVPEPGPHNCAVLAGELEGKFGDVVAEWKKSRAEVVEILENDKSLSRAKDTYHPDAVEEIISSLDLLARDFELAPPAVLEAIERLKRSKISEKPLRGRTPPKHALFDLCEEFSALAHHYFSELTHDFLAFARAETPARKVRLNVVTYDDLLTRVHGALTGSGGGTFAAMLGGQYRAALIDEFQDTDPMQYEIFRRIFGDGSRHLYFIGDPKQAIYGFRGADVFTYLRAARESSEKYTLTTNWRSEKRLLGAVNLLFERHPELGKGIEYRVVSAPEKPRAGFEELAGGEAARLRFRYLRNDDPGGKAFNQADAESAIRQAVVADIARLKAGGARLGTRELAYSDMAVLVRTNGQAAKMQELLRARGIKSVLKSDKSVFESGEAREVLMLLEGLLEPGRGHYLNTALVTSLFGIEPFELAGLEGDDAERQRKLEQFLKYRDLWRGSCFMAMFRLLLIEQKVRERLVEMAGGERKLTNFLHLAELLHDEETARKLTPDGLRLWLRKQIYSEDTVEEHQLRLESDEDGVLIATIHKCKGLEYPVVFCPFFFKAADSSKRTEILFHDPKANEELTFDLREPKDAPENDKLAGEERVGEALRMFYVAITRAKNLCHIYAGDISGFEESTLARVLDPGPTKPVLDALAAKSAGTIDVTLIDSDADAAARSVPAEVRSGEELHARKFTGRIAQTRMIASFSALISDSQETAVETVAEADHDTNVIVSLGAEAEIASDALPDFERGVRAGLFWHDLLEHLDFQKPETIDALVVATLASHGMAAAHRDAVCARLRQLLKAELKPGLALEKISAADRLAEVEFSYPIASLTPELIRGVFAKHGGDPNAADYLQNLGRLKFQLFEGFMRGFIDLLFQFDGKYYLVDWKSNWLGAKPEDYSAQALRSTMLGSFYFLQYHLYTVAVDLFLSRRVPGYDYEKHFGGVFYIFLRGVDAGKPGQGVYCDRPGAGLIADLSVKG